MGIGDDLGEKLRKIEALFAGATTPGEREAAGAAAERIRARLAEMGIRQAAIEMRFSIHDPWSRKLFLALARRYGIEPFRYPRMQRQTLIVRAPREFMEGVFWPEFNELNAALIATLGAMTDRIIGEALEADTGEAAERPPGTVHE